VHQSPALQGMRRDLTDGDIAMVTFLTMFLSENTEFRPDLKHKFLNPTQIPTMTALYNAFVAQYDVMHARFGDEVEECPVSEGHFRNKFKELFPDVKIPKTNKFAQCDICFELRQKTQLAAAANKQYYLDKLSKHHDDVLKDKMQYYENR